jgi:hypothetical protein
MTMKSRMLGVAALAALLCGCAAPDTVTATESPSEREYPTGSNIPRKKGAVADANSPSGMGVRAMSREEFERAQATGRGIGAKDGLTP